MHHLKPTDLQNTRVMVSRTRTPASRKAVIGLLVALIITVMIVWFGLLGWGVIELLRSIAGGLGTLWAKLF
jgi:hypothetical protein